MNKCLVILGSTATGKTDLALKLAKKFDGELVSCDSRQVYRGLDIGTGKLPSEKFKVQSAKFQKHKRFWEINGIKIHMYDVADPKEQYTVYDYVKDANRVIGDIQERGKLPIIVGGTGFYLKALLEGLPNLAVPVDLKLRKELEKLSIQQLQKRLQELSPDKWEKMNTSDRQNPRRLIRAIEIAIVKPNTFLRSDLIRSDLATSNVLKIGLTAPREVLYQRIDERVVSRIDQGMVDEARQLHKSGLSFKRMRQLGLEYGILADFLSGRIREIKGDQGLVKIMQGKIHDFARRQITWFKKTCLPAGREKNVFWFDITEKDYLHEVENFITKWYYQSVDVTKN